MSLRDAFAGIKAARQPPDPAQTDRADVTGRAPEPIPKAAPQAARTSQPKSRTPPRTEMRTEPPAAGARGVGKGVGKYRDPEYERLTVYVRKATRKAAARKWEDAGQRDLSSLVQALLVRYLDE